MVNFHQKQAYFDIRVFDGCIQIDIDVTALLIVVIVLVIEKI